MGRQGAVGEFEQLILLSTLRVGEQANGVSIRAEIEERTGREVARGAVYTTLDRLESKGLLSSRTGDPASGSARKRFYEVTPDGVAALREQADVVRALWSGLESVLGDL